MLQSRQPIALCLLHAFEAIKGEIAQVEDRQAARWQGKLGDRTLGIARPARLQQHLQTAMTQVPQHLDLQRGFPTAVATAAAGKLLRILVGQSDRL